MRIISKKSDVYDLQHSLFDADRTWVREEETFQVRVNKDTESLVKKFNFRTKGSYSESSYDVVVCVPVQIASEIHWLYRLTYWGKHEDGLGRRILHLNTFDSCDIEAFMTVNNLEIGSWFEKVKGLDQIKQKLSEVTPLAQRILGKLNVPLSMINKVVGSETDDTKYFHISTNFNFSEQKLPWQQIDSNLYRVHQMIESYIWGVIGNGEKQTVEVSDLDRLKAYGFDEKFSFRNRGK